MYDKQFTDMSIVGGVIFIGCHVMFAKVKVQLSTFSVLLEG